GRQRDQQGLVQGRRLADSNGAQQAKSQATAAEIRRTHPAGAGRVWLLQGRDRRVARGRGRLREAEALKRLGVEDALHDSMTRALTAPELSGIDLGSHAYRGRAS